MSFEFSIMISPKALSQSEPEGKKGYWEHVIFKVGTIAELRNVWCEPAWLKEEAPHVAKVFERDHHWTENICKEKVSESDCSEWGDYDIQDSRQETHSASSVAEMTRLNAQNSKDENDAKGEDPNCFIKDKLHLDDKSLP